MSNVTLQIGGRSYTVACGEGQEEHVAMLGRTVDEKLGSMDGHAGLSEQRALLFAALLLADEVHELKQAPGSAAQAPAPASSGASVDALDAMKLEVLASRLENLASSLEG